jgi:uncharacterized protein YjiS (DUF1127 family)
MSAHKSSSTAVRRQASAPRQPRVTVAQLFLRAVQRWQRNRAIAALQRLDDRYLEDIGVARSEIPDLAEKLFEPSARGKAEPSRRSPMIDRQLQQTV